MSTDKPRFTLTVPEEMKDDILSYQHKMMLSTQTKAVNELLRKGIESIHPTNEARIAATGINRKNVLASEEEMELIRLYRSMSAQGKKTLLVTARAFNESTYFKGAFIDAILRQKASEIESKDKDLEANA